MALACGQPDNAVRVCRDWADHYLKEGVEHFVGIDNGSDDQFRDEVEDLITSGKFTVIYDPLKHSQVRLYTQHCTPYLSGAVPKLIQLTL